MIAITKCCGMSFMVHLVVASALTLMAFNEARRPVKPTVVMLDMMDLPELPTPRSAPLPQHPELRLPVSARPGTPVREPAPVPVQARSVAAPVQTTPAPTVPTPGSPSASTRVAQPEPALDGQRGQPRQPAAATNAPAPVVPAGPAAPTEGQARSNQEVAQQRYLKENFAYIRELVTRKLVYPPLARRMNWSGKTVVSFILRQDGSVQHLKVLESSSHQVLDKTALETVQSVAPFPKPPVTAEIVLPVHFKMQP